MPNGTYGGVRGRKTEVGRKLLRFPPTRFSICQDGFITCWNQLAVLMFGQLSNRESLRDVALATQALLQKAIHPGFGMYATKSNLSKANNNIVNELDGSTEPTLF